MTIKTALIMNVLSKEELKWLRWAIQQLRCWHICAKPGDLIFKKTIGATQAYIKVAKAHGFKHKEFNP